MVVTVGVTYVDDHDNAGVEVEETDRILFKQDSSFSPCLLVDNTVYYHAGKKWKPDGKYAHRLQYEDLQKWGKGKIL